MGEEDPKVHCINLGMDGGIPSCDCSNFRLKGIPCEEACALICRMGLEPASFVRSCFNVTSQLVSIERALGGARVPNIVPQSLVTSVPQVFSPLLQPPPGRPAKKRKTSESARRAYIRKIKRQDERKNKFRTMSEGVITEGKADIGNQTNTTKREYICSRCGTTGHNAKRCRSYTDGRGTLMNKAAQIKENKH